MGLPGARHWGLGSEQPGCLAPTAKILVDEGNVDALSPGVDVVPGLGGEVPE